MESNGALTEWGRAERRRLRNPHECGKHTIEVQAEGIPGGCNTGSVSAWGGNLRIEVEEALA